MIATRRGLLRGLGALLAAPAIVRVASLMPVKALPAAQMWGDKIVITDFQNSYWGIVHPQLTGDLVEWVNVEKLTLDVMQRVGVFDGPRFEVGQRVTFG